MTAKSHHRCLVSFYFWGYKICTTLIKEKDIASFRHRMPMRTIRTMNTTAVFSMIGMLKKCTALIKEKEHGFIQAISDDEDDADDEYDSGVFPECGMLKICAALIKEKGIASFRHRVPMWTIRTIIWLRPIPFKLSVPTCNYHRRTPLLKPVCGFVSLFQRNRKVPTTGHSGLKSKISEKILFQAWYAHSMHKICAALNKEKDIASFRNPLPIRTMTWYFHIDDYCIDLLAAPNNREFTRSNRVYGHFCWNHFWEILSYRQREFWIMWNLQNRPINITDKTLSKALVNILIGWYNFHRCNRASKKLSVMKLFVFLKVP